MTPMESTNPIAKALCEEVKETPQSHLAYIFEHHQGAELLKQVLTGDPGLLVALGMSWDDAVALQSRVAEVSNLISTKKGELSSLFEFAQVNT